MRNVIALMCWIMSTPRMYRVADLDAAALLHDIGKLAAADGSVTLGLWLRGPMALMDSVAPARLLAVASANPSDGLRFAAYVHLEHPRIGAEWAEEDGCSELTCWLIRNHQTHISQAGCNGLDERWRLLQVLQAADNTS